LRRAPAGHAGISAQARGTSRGLAPGADFDYVLVIEFRPNDLACRALRVGLIFLQNLDNSEQLRLRR
jgi:hypothetical protein